MHISKVQIVNYRNFARADIRFNRGINTIIGENGSGKTNLFRAMRLLLDDNLLRMAYRLDETDFHRALGPWRGHWKPEGRKRPGKAGSCPNRFRPPRPGIRQRRWQGWLA